MTTNRIFSMRVNLKVFLIISINLLGLLEAPPIKKPSISFIFFKSKILLEFTDPPYKTFTVLFLTFYLGFFLTHKYLFLNHLF